MEEINYEPLRVVIALADNPHFDQIKCPVCGFEYNHMYKVESEDSHDSYDASWWGRGDLLIMDMECEEGHFWQLCIGYHKGMNYIFARLNAGDIPDEGKERTTRNGIPRVTTKK